jgi:hypothetical protein
LDHRRDDLTVEHGAAVEHPLQVAEEVIAEEGLVLADHRRGEAQRPSLRSHRSVGAQSQPGVRPMPAAAAACSGRRVGAAVCGVLTCRPFYRGDDAITAVGMMGVIGSTLNASRLVLT